ncbi:MAG: glucose-1-phosphate adenylyltransferase subunit GlgD [Defluviitaleaceae bacterium]|nr:glucose-1-phosphate adenylyltransferase subunit GlgD [Defluviitaleaceae bacterium]
MNAVGIILAGGNNGRLGELTKTRAVSAIPVGSCFRCLDFPLSNLSNSGIGKVAVLAQYNARSLQDHLSSSKWWNFGSKYGGLFVFSPYLSDDNSFWFRGTADSIYQNITYLRRSREEYVIITSGDAVYKADFKELLRNHEQSGADVTIMYKDAEPGQDLREFGVLTVGENGDVLDLEEKPLEPQGSKISMGIYVIKRTLLMDLLSETVSEGNYDLVKDIFVRYRKMLKINGFRFDGYWKAIKSVKSYFDVNMDFLRADIRRLFTQEQPYIETKPKDEPPAKYNSQADVADCLVGAGSIISGNIFHSVLFRRVYVGDGSAVKDSVLMEGTRVGNNCVLENVILDKFVTISDGAKLVGDPQNPIIISKGTTV